jgi:predicted dehydrogenase
VVSGRGPGARSAADRFGFRYCASDAGAIWSDDQTDLVFVAARNHLHAAYVKDAIAAGKHVFVEKPLALTPVDLDAIVQTYQQAAARDRAPLVGVGFNRRFAPATVAVRSLFDSVETPLTLVYRVNAGRLAEDSWVADPIEGGGRILSEACHFVDLCTFLLRSQPEVVTACGTSGANPNTAITIEYRSGSIAAITVSSGGDRSYSKERIELMGAGRVGVIDDFRRYWLVSGGRTKSHIKGWLRPQKGHRQEVAAFIDAVRSGSPAPIPFVDAVDTTRATFAIEESLRRRSAIRLGDECPR